MGFLIRLLVIICLSILVKSSELGEDSFVVNVAYFLVVVSPVIRLLYMDKAVIYNSQGKHTISYKIFNYIDVLYILALVGFGYWGVMVYTTVLYIVAEVGERQLLKDRR